MFLLLNQMAKLMTFYNERPSICSSPEPMAHYWWAYRIGRPPSPVHRPLSLNIFSETTGADWSLISYGVSMGWGNESLFNQSWSHDKDGYRAYNINGKNLKKSSSLEPKGRWPRNLVCGIGCSSTTKFVQWWPWVDLDLFYGKVKFGPLCFCMGKW